MTIRFVGVAAVLALAACSPGSNDAENTGTVTGEGVAKPSAVEAGQVRLAGDSIAVTGPLGTTLAFGSPREMVDAELTRVLGPAEDRSSNDECGAGPMEFTDYPGGLKVNFQDGKLIGWFLAQEGGSEIKTDRDIAPGSTEADVGRAYRMERVDSTLGDEFYSDENIGGFFEETTKKVDSLFAGTNCFFR